MPKNEPQNRADPKPEPQDPVEKLLTQADFSRAAGQRASLRSYLLSAPARRPGLQRLLRPALEGAGLLVLLFAFFLVVSGLFRNSGRPTQPASAIKAYPMGTALPVGTAYPAGTAYPEGTAYPAAGPTPTQTPYVPNTPAPTPQPLLDAASSPDAVRLAISQPRWRTLWADIELDSYSASSPAGQPDSHALAQVWLENGGRGLVASSDALPGAAGPTEISWSALTLFDGHVMTRFQPATQEKTTLQQDAGVLSPLIGASPAVALVYPDFLMILSSNPRPLRMEQLLDRWTVVVDWGNARLWVDIQSGLLLKAERYAGAPGSSSLESVLFMRNLLLNPTLEDYIFRIDALPTQQAHVLPAVTPVPQFTPTAWADYSAQGWVYLQSAGQAPFEWKVYSMPASCLFGSRVCSADWQLIGNPNLQIGGMQFAPDHSIAVFSDTNENRLVALDVSSRQWLAVVPGFFQINLVWSPDGSQIAALGEGDGAYDDSLEVISRDGWTVRKVPTSLKGNKQILGWLDAQRVAILIRPNANWKGGIPAWVDQFKPGLFAVDVNSGQDTTLIGSSDAGAKGTSLSPDGSQVAFTEIQGDQTVIGLSAPDGSNWHSLGVQGGMPVWSADGQWISLESNRTDNSGQFSAELLLVHPDGSGVRTVLQANGNFEYLWSPDSKYLLISVHGDPAGATSYIYDIAAGTLNPVTLTAFNNSMAWNLLGWEP